MKKIIGLLAFCSAVALVSSPAHALVTVAAGGGADFTTIQAGLDAAAPGEEVQVTDGGTYAEALNVNGEVLTSVPAGATINADGNGAIIWGDLDATIDGFTIIAAANGVHIDGSPADVQIMNCTINAPVGVNFGAGTSTATITNCTINANNHGVLFNAGEDSVCTITGSTISAAVEHGITIFRSATLNLDNSTVTNCGGRGVYVDGTESTATGRVITITNSEISNCTGDGIITARPNYTLNVTDSQIINNDATGFYVFNAGADSTDYNCTFTNTLINNNGSCMAIHRAGNYTFTGCQINGNGTTGPDPNWQGAFFIDGNSAGATFNFTNTTVNDNFQRGIFTGRPINLNMDSCQVNGNGAQGVWVDDFHGATGFGINVAISNSTFLNNGAWGVVVPAKELDATATITDCTFSGNAQFALSCQANNAASGKTVLADIQRNIFLDGIGNTGTIVDLNTCGAGSQVVNNLFEQGAPSLNIVNSAANVYHNTIVGTADGTGMNIENLNDKVVNVKNNIIAGADMGIISNAGTGLANLAIENNLILAVTAEGDATIAPLLGATNILGVSPDFLSASDVVGAGNYHLSDTSPALGRGAALGVTDDLDEVSRPLPAGSAPDLGAYENALVPVEISNFMID